MSSSSDNLQSWLATVKLGKFLAEADLIKLCEIVKGKLLEEPNIRPVSSPVTVCGDVQDMALLSTQTFLLDLLTLLLLEGPTFSKRVSLAMKLRGIAEVVDFLTNSLNLHGKQML